MARASLALLACLASATSYRLGATPRPHAFASHMDAPRLGPRVPTTARMDEARSPRTSVYQTLSDEQIDNIHKVADAAFNVIDRNGDESVTKEELAAPLLLARYGEPQIAALFDTVDVNNDGTVSRTELREAFVRHPPLRSAPGMGTLQKSKRAAVHDEADALFTKLDIDQSGTLSIQELSTHLMAMEDESRPESWYSEKAIKNIWSTLDADGNGELTRSEFRGGYVRFRAMRLALYDSPLNY